MLCSLCWRLCTEISGQLYGPIFKVRQSKQSFFMDHLTLEDGTNRLSWNIIHNYQHTLHNIPEEGRPQLYHSGSQESIYFFYFGTVAQSRQWPPHSWDLQTTHNAPQLVGLLWIGDQLVAETESIIRQLLYKQEDDKWVRYSKPHRGETCGQPSVYCTASIPAVRQSKPQSIYGSTNPWPKNTGRHPNYCTKISNYITW
jgi:hypothetical protein